MIFSGTQTQKAQPINRVLFVIKYGQKIHLLQGSVNAEPTMSGARCSGHMIASCSDDECP